MAARNNPTKKTAEQELVLTHVFNAPRSLVFKAGTDPERKTFEAGHESMQQGWTGTLDQLAEYLAKSDLR